MTSLRETPGASGWNGVIFRTVQVALIALAALLVKEWTETRQWDLGASAIDAGWVGGAALVFYALSMVLSPGGRK